MSLKNIIETVVQKFNKEEQLALEWEARMCARAHHRMNPKTSVVALDDKYRKLLEEKALQNRAAFFKGLMPHYQKSLQGTGAAQQKFEKEYVAKKVQLYQMHQRTGQGR